MLFVPGFGGGGFAPCPPQLLREPPQICVHAARDTIASTVLVTSKHGLAPLHWQAQHPTQAQVTTARQLGNSAMHCRLQTHPCPGFGHRRMQPNASPRLASSCSCMRDLFGYGMTQWRPELQSCWLESEMLQLGFAPRVPKGALGTPEAAVCRLLWLLGSHSAWT